MNGVSLFTGAGIGENYLKQVDLEIIAANELVPRRADLYNYIYKNTHMVQGDISNKKVFNKVIELGRESNIDFVLASPPCQGISVAGKNRSLDSMSIDVRNYLIYHVIDVVHKLNPSFVLIENVTTLLKLLLLHKGSLMKISDILFLEFGHIYNIEANVVDAADFGVPQTRKRTIIKMYKKGSTWKWPVKEKKKSVFETIGHLPSLESEQKSSIKWHFARKHNDNHILWMRNTPTGKSAFENKVHFPKKEDGTRIKGYESTYRRIKWNEPSPTITIRSDAISSQKNVHPGRKLVDGTFSDARVLTPLELMLLNSLPEDWNIPTTTSELLIRQTIGESIPPLMLKKIIGEI